jgi:hypothetical protein
MSIIKEMIKDKQVTFLHYFDGDLWYTTECGFQFPVPISDAGTAKFLAQDKAMLFMRYIRKHLEVVKPGA